MSNDAKLTVPFKCTMYVFKNEDDGGIFSGRWEIKLDNFDTATTETHTYSAYGDTIEEAFSHMVGFPDVTTFIPENQ